AVPVLLDAPARRGQRRQGKANRLIGQVTDQRVVAVESVDSDDMVEVPATVGWKRAVRQQGAVHPGDARPALQQFAQVLFGRLDAAALADLDGQTEPVARAAEVSEMIVPQVPAREEERGEVLLLVEEREDADAGAAR